MITQKKRKKTELQKLTQAVTPAVHPDSDVFLDNMVRVIGDYGFQQILLPAVERRRTFQSSQMLSRMYGDSLPAVSGFASEEMILAPTKLPAVISRYLANVKTAGPRVSKWFHISPVARFVDNHYEFSHELGLFVLGEDSALASSQLINTTAEILRALGSVEFVVQINSLGCASCQGNYQEFLSSRLAGGAGRLCEDCTSDFEKNPLVIWNCVNGTCQRIAEALPPIVDSLDEQCKADLMGVLEGIDELNIPYNLNPTFIPQHLRHQVVFQFVAADDPVNRFGHGGNFSALAGEVGATEPLPMLGMLSTFEKIMSAVPEERRRQGPRIEVFMVPLGVMAARKAMVLHRDLQHSGILSAEAMLISPSIKNQLKVAVEKKCEIALIIGQKEALDETVILRDMRSGMQEVFAADRIIEEVKKRLGK